MKKRFCYYVSEFQRDAQGFIPSIVYEGEPGHRPLSGNPENGTAGYHWGKTIEEAQAACDAKNADMGLTPDDVNRIICSSMFAK